MAFPTTLDTFVNPSGSSTTDNPSLSAAVTNAGNGIETLMIKVGIDSSAENSSHDRKLSNVIGSDKAASVTGAETLTNKTLFTPVIDSALILTQMDFDGKELILDGDADTSITADTDDQIDIRIAANDDFRFTANLFAALPGSSIRTPSATAFKSRNNADGADIDLIASNSSDQTTIGQNSVRATRFVPVTPAVVVVNLDPANTNWIAVDVTANTSATCYAISVFARILSGTSNRNVFIRKNGDATAAGDVNRLSLNPVAGVSGLGSKDVEVDSGQIFEWSVDNADVNPLVIVLTGFWEFVD